MESQISDMATRAKPLFSETTMTTSLILLALLFLPAGLLADNISGEYYNYMHGSSTCGKALLNKRTIRITPWGRSAAPYVRNGNDTYYGEWPFVAWVRLNGTWCSGVIYSSEVVFTAAHCIRQLFKDWDAGIKTEITNPELQAYVVVGKINFKSTDRYEAKYNIKAVQMGAYFDQRNVDARGPDFARLWLREPIQFSNYVEPVCVLRDVSEIDRIAQDKVFFIGNGFNWERVTPWTHPEKTQWIEMRSCDESYWAGMKATAQGTLYCSADDITRAICHGDSGGPLVGLDKNKRWVLIGLGTGSFGLCFVNLPTKLPPQSDVVMMDKIVGMFDENFKPSPNESAMHDGFGIFQNMDPDR